MKIEIETNNIEKIERQANEYIDLYFLASNMFSRLDTNMKLSRTKLDFEKVAEIIKRDELHSLYKEVIRYLESNNEMFVLLPNNKKIILNDMSETYFDEDDIKIYNECLDYNSVYYSTSLPSQWPVATGLTFVPYTNQLDIVRTYRLKLNNAYNIIVGVRYNGSMADSDAILRRVYNNVITEGYILMTENGKAKITQLRRNKFETVKTVNGIAEVTLDNDEIVSLIDNIRKQSDKPSAYIALSHDAKERYAVAVNTGDTNILKLFFVDYDDILFLEHKTKEIIRRIIILYVIMLIGVLGLEKNREKNEKKREAIILHNNY